MSQRSLDVPVDKMATLYSSVTAMLVRARKTMSVMFANDLAKAGTVLILFFSLMGIAGPALAPQEPNERVVTESGSWVTNAAPAFEYPLGTNPEGFSIFAQVVAGAQTAFIVGLFTAFIVGVIGTTVGLLAGYYGGMAEDVLMRVVDIAYGLPFIPFAIIVVVVAGRGLFSVILAIAIIFWRDVARVVRSEAVSVREKEMIDAARMSGASDARIIFYHILPVILPISLVYSVFAIGWAIIGEAALSFLGLGAPNTYSWGTILNDAYTSQAFLQGQLLWLFAPGLCLTLFVTSWYFIAQGAEEVVNPELRSQR
jgi:peptide/nickel transport system permease protein